MQAKQQYREAHPIFFKGRQNILWAQHKLPQKYEKCQKRTASTPKWIHDPPFVSKDSSV